MRVIFDITGKEERPGELQIMLVRFLDNQELAHRLLGDQAPKRTTKRWQKVRDLHEETFVLLSWWRNQKIVSAELTVPCQVWSEVADLNWESLLSGGMIAAMP